MDKQMIIKARWVKINRLLILLIVFFLGVLIVREYQTFRDSVNYFNQTSYDYHIHSVQHEVDNRVEEIEAVKEQIQKNFRNELKATVTDVDFFAQQVVDKAEGVLTLEEKRELYIDAIYQYDIQENEYLFFAMDLDGKSYLSGVTKNLEGTDISFLQDAVTGDYFVLDMIDIINDSPTNDGFISYYWLKEVEGEHLLKTSYILYNEELDLFIGTGIYDVDYIESVQQELFRRISSYYDSLDDYIYIMDYDGKIIFHPLEDFDQEALFEIKTTDGVGFHQYIVEQLETQESITFDYYYNFTNENQTKTAYVRQIEEWDMYIGKSFVFDDLQLQQTHYLQSIIVNYIIFNVLTGIAVTTMIIFLKRLINDNFKDVRDEFTQQNDLIKEISYRDQLTGIYNRKYFDVMITNLSSECNLISALMIDANGLKLINDAYGHEAGDDLLIRLTQIIKRVFTNSTIFRWGGDEFVVLDFNDENVVKTRIQEFHDQCQKEDVHQFTISASVGYAMGNPEKDEIFEIINQAEIIMYDNKMYESLSTRRQIIDNILNTLYNSFSFEELHSENVKNYAMIIGNELGLEKEDLNKLRLGALMHDVGKIGVPDDILQKKEPLTKSEFDEVRKHPEKGMRILSAYPELSEFGNYALTHHEKFDGTGYPRGLTGDEIPLFSRIITIADAFDAMTSNRVYKKCLSKEEALEELLNNQGTQFDPRLVDIFVKVMR